MANRRFLPKIRGLGFFLAAGLVVVAAAVLASFGRPALLDLVLDLARGVVAAAAFYAFVRFVVDPRVLVLKRFVESGDAVGLAIYLACYAFIFGICLAL